MVKVEGKNEMRPSSTRTTVTVSTRTILCIFPLFIIFSVIAYVFAPTKGLITQPHISTNIDKAQCSSHPNLKEDKKLPSQEAENLLIESLSLLQDLLIRISENENSSAQSEDGPKNILARGLISDITGFFSGKSGGGGLGGIGNLLSEGAADASKYLGVGIGNGTITGLDVPNTYLQKNRAISEKKPSGINLIAENLGKGLSSSIVGSINVSSLVPGTSNIGPASRALAQGVGSGAAAGLNLKQLNPKAFNTTGIPGIAGNFGQGLSTGFIADVDLKNLMMMAMSNLAPGQTNMAALSLARGLGGGAAYATKLTSTPPNTLFDPNGISGISGNIGQGLSTSFIEDINLKNLMMMATSGLAPGQANMAALSLARGLGGGAAYATKLTTTPPNTTFNPNGISGISGNIGQGLSTSFIENVDVKNLMMMAMSGLAPGQANMAALSLAQGLGGGAAFATKLTTAPPNTTFNPNGISGISGNFGQGLSVSFLQNVDIKQMFNGAAPKLTRKQIMDAAEGMGMGLAGGAVVGIGLQPESAVTEMDPNMEGLGPVTQKFARGLSQSFLSNGTALKLVDYLGQGKDGPKMNMAAIAKGLGIGLVDGAQISIANAGGIEKILNTGVTGMGGKGGMGMPTEVTHFDDSVSGAALGFGNGLGMEATKSILQVFTNSVNQSSNTPNLNNLDEPRNTTTVSGTTTPQLNKRQSAVMDSKIAPNESMYSAQNSSRLISMINPILQKGADSLGCQGVGGLVAIIQSAGLNANLQGDMKSQAIKTLSNFGIGDQTFTVRDKNENRFEINISKLLIYVNGNSIYKEFSLLALHIFLASVAFFLAIPIILIINSIHNFAVMSGRQNVLKNFKKIQWSLALIVLLPSSLGILLLGVIAEGRRSHFKTPHGILGLILILLTLAVLPLAFFRSKSHQVKIAFNLDLVLILSLTLVELISGISDLSNISFCIFQFIPQFIFVLVGFLITAPLLQSITMISLELILSRWKVESFPGALRVQSPLDEKVITSKTAGLGRDDEKIPDSFMSI